VRISELNALLVTIDEPPFDWLYVSFFRNAVFVLRPADPGKQSKVLLQIATNTYHAYTNWGGGVCTPTTAGRLTIANGTSVGDKITNRITKNVIE